MSDVRAMRAWLRAACEPRSDGWADPLYGLGLGGLYVALLLATVGDLGYARDEGFYFQAARAYQAWFELWASDPARAMHDADAYWRTNSEHPAFVKSLFALSHWLLWDKLRLFSMEGTSYRFPAMALSGLAVAVVYLWGARARGRLAGIVAAGSLALMPRFFFHAHLACFDAPAVATWTLCAYAWWRALQKGGVARALGVGLAFGIALNTKHNAWFLPIVCGLHAAVLLAGRERKRMGRAAMALAAMATVGPLSFWASWPWLWRDTVARLTDYAAFHLGHVYYNMEFLGRNYWRPPMPRSYALVMTAATVPLVTLALFALGLVVAARRRGQARRSFLPACDPATGWLWAIAIAVQYGAWLRPETPIFGGTKHWMTAYPFVALFAAEGLRAAVLAARHAWLRRPLRPLVRGRALEIAFAAAALLPPLIQALHAHPWGLSFYNVLAGGAPGAATLGLNRSFWGYTTGAVVPYLNASAPHGASIYPHDTAAQAWEMLVRDGRMRDDLRAVRSVAASQLSLYHHEKHMAGEEYQAWVHFETVAPAYIAGLDGVPIIWIYASGRAGQER